MTILQDKDALRRVGVTLRKRDGEYRVNFLGGGEATAYYTNDLEDALGTGQRMSAEKTSPPNESVPTP